MVTVETLMSQGIEEALAKSLVAQFEREATRAAKPKAKGKYIPPEAFNRPKKTPGRLEITQICATCGGREVRSICTMLDPRNPQATEVVVGICNGCIPLYRTLDQTALISLILLKSHPDITIRMLSNLQQLKIARTKTPEEVMLLRSDVEPAPDTRYLKPQYDE